MEALLVYLAIVAVSASGWSTRTLGRRAIRTAALSLAVVTVAAAVLRPEIPLFWSNLAVLGTSMATGIWVGRAVAPRFWPMATLLLVLAALDASQLLFAGGTGRGSATVWFHLTWLRGDGTQGRLGIADLIVAAAIGEHLRRRGARPLRSTLTPVGGFLLADTYVFLTSASDLVLLPFLAAAWLLQEAVGAWRSGAAGSG